MKWGKFEADFFYRDDIGQLLAGLDRDAILVYLKIVTETWRLDDDYANLSFQARFNLVMLSHQLNMKPMTVLRHVHTLQTLDLLRFTEDRQTLTVTISNYAKYKHREAFSSRTRSATGRPSGLSREEGNREGEKIREENNFVVPNNPTTGKVIGSLQGNPQVEAWLSHISIALQEEWAKAPEGIPWLQETILKAIRESEKGWKPVSKRLYEQVLDAGLKTARKEAFKGFGGVQSYYAQFAQNSMEHALNPKKGGNEA